MKLVIFGGTTEGRELSHRLAARGADVTVCTATAYGREEQREVPGVTVLAGRRTAEEMTLLLRGADLCVDATHPYAVEATDNIRRACAASGTPCRRLLRPGDGAGTAAGTLVNSAVEAGALLLGTEGNILLTTGVKELGAFSALDPERLFPRVLPSPESLEACEAAGIPHRNILAMQGPFSQELNEALIRQFRIACMVTKDGGKAGGFGEKVRAAERTGTRLIIIRRPEETGETMEEIIRDLESALAGGEGRTGGETSGRTASGTWGDGPLEGGKKMRVDLAALGCGPASVTREALEALEQADCILGAVRLLESLPERCTGNRIAAVKAEEIIRALEERRPQRPCAVFSGDAGLYSGARRLLPLLEERGWEGRVLPGISSLQLLAARLGRPWQDWKICSAHGVPCDAVAAVMEGRPAFFLTGGALGPAELCRQWTEAGLGNLAVTVGENLSLPGERISAGRAEELVRGRYAPLSVVLAEAAPEPFPRRTAGLDDGEFLRGEVPMTKQEVRSVILAKLAVRPDDTVWDVGAGSGSVSIELSRAACRGRTFAVECREEALALLRRNRERFGAWNLKVVPGAAPEALESLPAPDAVFIGGTRGRLAEIVDAVLKSNRNARVCISAITLETLAAALAALAAHGLEAEAAQISVSRTKAAGKLHLLAANNPVFLISGQAGKEGAP